MTGLLRSVLGSLVLVAAAAFTLTPDGAAVASPRNVFDDLIVIALENLREHMSEGWPELGVPPLDPLNLGLVNIDIHNNGTNVQGSMTEVTMNGLSTFDIDLVRSNVLLLRVEIGLVVPLLDIAGKYNLTGQTGVFPIFGDGPFWLDGVNFTISATVDLGDTEEGFFGVLVLDLDTYCPSTNIHFEDIMGGGDMADFVNDVLSSLGPDFLQAIEDEYMPWLEEALKHEINQILQESGESKSPRDESVNDYFDLVFANMRQSIIENGQDPIALPGDSDNFTVILFNQTVEGGVEVGPGKLSGMSTVHRAGDMELLYVGEEDEVVWKGEVGLIDLEVDYRFGVSLPLLLSKDLRFTAKMSFIHLSFETDVFLHQSGIVLPYCNITELGPVHFKEKGTGPLDTSLYNALFNLLLGELKGLVNTAVENAVCTLLEDAFSSSG